MDHICTNESYLAGGIDVGESECQICCRTGKQTATFVGCYCHVCKKINSAEWAGQIARERRLILGLTKKQIAEKLGISKHTVHGYEWKKCPIEYLDRLKELLIHTPDREKHLVSSCEVKNT